MVLCIIVGCGTKTSNNDGIGLFRIPAVIHNQGEAYKKLTQDRRNAWISAVSRDDTGTKAILNTERVCGKHFISGQPALPWDKYNKDWKPTQNLGKKEYRKKDLEAAEKKAERVKLREQVREQEREAQRIREQALLEQQEREARQEWQELLERREREPATKRLRSNDIGEHVANIDFASAPADQMDLAENSMTSGSVDAETQTEEFDYMFRRGEYQAPNREFFKSDAKVRFYTGLPSYEVLMVVFEHVSPHISRNTQTLDQFQEFVLVLMKLRLNVPLQDLAYRFMVSLPTISRIFAHWMVVMDIRLKGMIYWPERDELWATMPMCFQYSFGKKVTVVIDCFEVFIDRPSILLARAQTFSSYKHHNTIKVLIGITPQGSVCYVSEAWGGRTSDKFLTENCGFLDKVLPGDMVMADRGFTISESVGLQQARLVIPAFTKGKTQLDPVDVERTRGIANVRIHVERVIGLLRRKYTILQSILPIDFLACNPDGAPDSQIPMIDRMIRVCSALVNFCPSIIPFD